jgi:anionic cell wall polymer biosynthesis LytR-Cps2A-Psr (LCP) family protein
MNANGLILLFMNLMAIILFFGGSLIMWKIFGKSVKARSSKKKEEKKAKKLASKEAKKAPKVEKKDDAPTNIAPDIQLSGGDKKTEGLSLGDWKTK